MNLSKVYFMAKNEKTSWKQKIFKNGEKRCCLSFNSGSRQKETRSEKIKSS